jgi:hypothetical protein
MKMFKKRVWMEAVEAYFNELSQQSEGHSDEPGNKYHHNRLVAEIKPRSTELVEVVHIWARAGNMG